MNHLSTINNIQLSEVTNGQTIKYQFMFLNEIVYTSESNKAQSVAYFYLLTWGN